MNTGQHAHRILNAWQTSSRSKLEAALENAQRSCWGVRPISRLETEQQDLLESIVDHLQLLGRQDSFPAFSERCGARLLLSHLRASTRQNRTATMGTANFTTKN